MATAEPRKSSFGQVLPFPALAGAAEGSVQLAAPREQAPGREAVLGVLSSCLALGKSPFTALLPVPARL